LIRPRVDLHQQISLMHKLALGKCNLEDIAVDPALDRDGVVGLHRADPPHDDRHVLGLDCAAKTGTAGRALSSPLLCFSAAIAVALPPNASHELAPAMPRTATSINNSLIENRTPTYL
jgi:hypothetical protein